jgi:hypothetical protein
VYLDEAPDDAPPRPEEAGSSPLVADLRDQVGYLREQLRREQDAHAEARRIIAALTSRIPEIEAPASGATEPREASTEATEQPGRVEPQPAVGGAQEGSQRAPWWRRVFGG